MYDPSEALLQLGLYDYVWGDPTMLNVYNSNVQAQKAREAQEQYNNYWKQVELENAKAEKAKADALDRKEKDAKLAELYKQYNNANGAQERALIKKQIRALEGNGDVENEMLTAYDQDRRDAEEAAQKESVRHSEALKEMGKIQKRMREAKTPEEKDSIARTVYDEKIYPKMNRTERDNMYSQVMGIKTIGEMVNDANKGALAGHAGKKTGDKLDLNDVLERSKKSGYVPSSADKELMRKNGYFWDKKLKNYVQGAK